jgi:hypothetical protein
MIAITTSSSIKVNARCLLIDLSHERNTNQVIPSYLR